MQQKLVQNYLQQETGGFGINIGKKQQKAKPKVEKLVYYIFIDNICFTCNPMQRAVF